MVGDGVSSNHVQLRLSAWQLPSGIDYMCVDYVS